MRSKASSGTATPGRRRDTRRPWRRSTSRRPSTPGRSISNRRAAAVAERLYRSRDERMIAGVAGGMADALDVDPTLVRIGWGALGLVTGGVAILLYFVLLFVIPEEPYGGGFAPGGDTLGTTEHPGGTAGQP